MPPQKKKGPTSLKAKKIVELRDSLIAKGLDPEKVGLACKGMFRCDKLVDDKCLDEILAKLNKIKEGGGHKRTRSRSRSKSPTKAAAKSPARSRSKSRRK